LDYISLQYSERFTRPFLLVLLEKVKEYAFSSQIIVKHVGVNFNHNNFQQQKQENFVLGIK